MKMSKSYPRTIQQLFNNKEWMRKLRTCILRFNLPEDVEDTLSEVILMMFVRKLNGLTYIERWTPKLGSFSNWVYTFTNNICRKKYTKAKSSCGTALRKSSTIVPDGKEDLQRGEVMESFLRVDEFSYAEFDLQIEDISKHLASFQAHSWVQYGEESFVITNNKGEEKEYKGEVPEALQGQKVCRDLRTVFQMLVDGLEPKDIASVMKTSPTYIYSQIRRLRDISEVKNWHGQALAA